MQLGLSLKVVKYCQRVIKQYLHNWRMYFQLLKQNWNGQTASSPWQKLAGGILADYYIISNQINLFDNTKNENTLWIDDEWSNS